MTLKYVYVRMADDEWQSNTNMQMLAAEQLKKHGPENTVIHVQEHAGWWLEYAVHNNQIIIVGTANDGATPTTERRSFWDKHQNSQTVHGGSVNRNELTKEERKIKSDVSKHGF